jgi:hypothetical protein
LSVQFGVKHAASKMNSSTAARTAEDDPVHPGRHGHRTAAGSMLLQEYKLR